jgi:Flp pilus assembly protein TadD
MLKIFHSQALFYKGEPEEGIEKLREVLENNPQMDGIRPLLASYLACAGHSEEARAELTEDALALSKADHDMAYWVGAAYAALDERDLAFKWLERAVKLGNENKPWYENNKCLDSIRSDPRFADLLQKIEGEISH